jgi:hypothetical protein
VSYTQADAALDLARDIRDRFSNAAGIDPDTLLEAVEGTLADAVSVLEDFDEEG